MTTLPGQGTNCKESIFEWEPNVVPIPWPYWEDYILVSRSQVLPEVLLEIQSTKLNSGICRAEEYSIKGKLLISAQMLTIWHSDPNLVSVISDEGYHQSQKAINLRKRNNTAAGQILQMATAVNYGDAFRWGRFEKPVLVRMVWLPSPPHTHPRREVSSMLKLPIIL